MGNRAIITTEKRNLGVYLHWDGSPEQVQGFLAYCDLMGFRKPETDDYGWAQLVKVIGNYIDGNKRSTGTSIGILRNVGKMSQDGNCSTYVIENWEIIKRLPEKEWTGLMPEELFCLLYDINACQPFRVESDELARYAYG